MTAASLVELVQEAWSDPPSRVVAAAREPSAADVTRLLDVWRDSAEASEITKPSATQVWPLMSHHTYAGRTLFRSDATTSLLPRVLTTLLVHDGIVAADPLVEVDRLMAAGRSDDARRLVHTVVRGLADAEPLIKRGLLRFTRIRPTLNEENRSAILEFFGVDSKMTVFTNFMDAAASVAELPYTFRREYAPQVNELYRRFGLVAPDLPDLEHGVLRIKDLAAALIEVSWQMAVCAAEPGCDLTLASDLETRLAELVLAGDVNGHTNRWQASAGRTRHMQHLAIGSLPNLDTEELTVVDAIAIRRSDAFEAFRSHLGRALDDLDATLAAGRPEYVARVVFEERMQEASRLLERGVVRSTLRTRLRDAAVPAAIGAVSGATIAPLGPGFAAGGSAMTALTAVLWQWLTARATPSGRKVAQRYVSMLGNSAAVSQS